MSDRCYRNQSWERRREKIGDRIRQQENRMKDKPEEKVTRMTWQSNPKAREVILEVSDFLTHIRDAQFLLRKWLYPFPRHAFYLCVFDIKLKICSSWESQTSQFISCGRFIHSWSLLFWSLREETSDRNQVNWKSMTLSSLSWAALFLWSKMDGHLFSRNFIECLPWYLSMRVIESFCTWNAWCPARV
jgi:hypothetical protein